MFFNSCFNNLKAIDYPLDIDVVLIQFNYDLNSYSEDAYSIVPGYNSLVIQNEWINDGGISKNDKIAYIKSQTNRKIKVKFWHNQNQSQSYNMAIGGFVAEGTSFGYASYSYVTFPSNNNGYSSIKTYQLNGTVPNSVGKRYVKFVWECVSINGENYIYSLGFTGKHYYYTLLAAPQAPMATPWVPVLEYACNWANEQTTETTVLTEITKGLYNISGFQYDIFNGASRYSGWSTHSFNLTSMLSEIGSSNIIVNCYDMGKAVKIFSTSLGCNTIYQYSNPFGYLNCIKPIGRDWTNNPFYPYPNLYPPYNIPIVGEDNSYPQRTPFGNHAFGCLGTNIYDACLKVDTDSNPDYGPPHTESWATGWSWTNYKSKVVDNNPATNTGNPVSYNFSVY